MATVILDHESIPAGGNATTANSGWDAQVVPGTGGFITGETAAALSGNIGLRLTCGSTTCIVERTLTSATQQMVRMSWKKFPATVSADSVIARFYGGVGGSVAIANITVKATGEIYTSSALGATTGIIVSAANGAALAGQPFSLSVYINSGTGTGDGTLQARAYASPSTAAGGTLIQTAFSATTWNLGSGNPLTRFRMGWISVQASNSMDVDYIQIVDGSSTWLDGVPAASTPTVTASTLTTGTNSTDIYPEAGQPFNLLATRSGTFTSGTWSNVAPSGGRARPDGAATPSIATPTAVGAVVSGAGIIPGQYVFRHQLVWSGGVVDAYVTIYVHAAAGNEVGIWDTTGPWAVGGAVTTRRAAYADNLSTTYGESGDNPGGADIDTITVNPVGMIGTLEITPTALFTGGPGTSWTIKAYKNDGVTLLNTYVWNPAQDVETSPASAFVLDMSALTTLDSRKALILTSIPLV